MLADPLVGFVWMGDYSTELVGELFVVGVGCCDMGYESCAEDLLGLWSVVWCGIRVVDEGIYLAHSHGLKSDVFASKDRDNGEAAE